MIILTKEQIDACFEGKDHQAKAMVDLYRLVYPDWDNIEKLHGWPKCSKAFWIYVMNKFRDFDRKHHRRNVGSDRDVMPGGLWFNSGFSCHEENIPVEDSNGPWLIDPSSGQPEYKETPLEHAIGRAEYLEER